MRALPLIAATALLLIPAAARAQDAPIQKDETDFTVTVRAKDSNFINTAMGGAQVIIRDRRTGDIIVSGIPHGASAGKDRASLEFSMELLEPTPVTISATGPGAQAQSAVTSSFDTVLIPGKDYTSGDGIVIDLPGYAVDVVSPAAGAHLKFNPEKPITIMANIIKMCDCPVAKAADIQVDVHVYKGAALVASLPLEYSGADGLFNKNIKLPAAGDYRFTVTAFDPKTREAGMDSTGITLSP